MSIHYNTLVIQDNEKITEEIYKLTLFSEIKLDPYPGQFILLCCEDAGTYLSSLVLKRPFSFYKLIDNNTFEVVVRANGNGTKKLVSLEKGSRISFLGPLGNPPPLVDICNKYPNGISLVGGGMGIIPLVLMAQCFSVGKYRRVSAYVGFKKADEFSQMIIRDLHISIHWSNIQTAYEDEYKPTLYSGTVLDLFDEYNDTITTPIFTCGPELMMEYLHKRCNDQDEKFPCYCFMERRMACGIGACHSCDVNGKSVCKDGPCIESKYIFK